MYPQTAKDESLPRGLLRGLLVFEVLRLAVLTRLMAGGEGEFSSLIYGSPNALFPLMVLFMAADFQRHRAYLPLYTAGKALSVLVLFSAGLFRQEKIIRSILMEEAAFLREAGSLLALALGDLLSVLCGALLILRRKRVSPEEIREIQDPALDTADHGGL
jgi:hypothetical protein